MSQDTISDLLQSGTSVLPAWLGANRIGTIIIRKRDETRMKGKERKREINRPVCIEAARSSRLMELFVMRRTSQFSQSLL